MLRTELVEFEDGALAMRVFIDAQGRIMCTNCEENWLDLTLNDVDHSAPPPVCTECARLLALPPREINLPTGRILMFEIEVKNIEDMPPDPLLGRNRAIMTIDELIHSHHIFHGLLVLQRDFIRLRDFKVYTYLFSVESYLAILSHLEHQEPYVAVSPPGIYGNAWLFSHQRARCGGI